MIPQCENSSLRSISREVDLAWLAGIVDGEGNLQFDMKKACNGKRYFCPKVRVSNTDVRMIKKIAEIYKENNIVFFYTINKRNRYNDKWKDQLHIEVASQGSVKKLLNLIIPFMVNKADVSRKMVNVIDFVMAQPKGGNTVCVDYANDDRFKKMYEEYETSRLFYVNPSTTTRRAGTVCTW